MSRKYFFIYSLPRSGSAWLSLFLSQPGCFCLHEPLANRGTIWQQLKNRPEPVLGAIDTSAYAAVTPPILPDDSEVFALWRSANEIEESGRRLGVQVDAHLEQSLLLEAVKQHFSGVEVPHERKIFYKDLWSLSYLEDLWNQIVGEGFDRERTEYLIEMNVQRSVQSIVQRMRRAASQND